MSEFIPQLPALIGVVIGALGSYVAVVRSDRARFHRERAARWEERRLAVYSDYARTLKKTITPACWRSPHSPGLRKLERHRNGRDGYYAAVRDDLALPPGLAVWWQLPPVRPS